VGPIHSEIAKDVSGLTFRWFTNARTAGALKTHDLWWEHKRTTNPAAIVTCFLKDEMPTMAARQSETVTLGISAE
jgi:hypothetical protein